MAKAKVKERENKFKKEQLLNSKRYAEHRDVISALLKEDECYTLQEVDKVIKKFMEERVK